jgi:hypothetical protein
MLFVLVVPSIPLVRSSTHTVLSVPAMLFRRQSHRTALIVRTICAAHVHGEPGKIHTDTRIIGGMRACTLLCSNDCRQTSKQLLFKNSTSCCPYAEELVSAFSRRILTAGSGASECRQRISSSARTILEIPENRHDKIRAQVSRPCKSLEVERDIALCFKSSPLLNFAPQAMRIVHYLT